MTKSEKKKFSRDTPQAELIKMLQSNPLATIVIGQAMINAANTKMPNTMQGLISDHAWQQVIRDAANIFTEEG